MNRNFIFEIYKDERTVFNLQEIAMLVRETDFERLKQRINYFVRTGKLKNIRRGIYVKENYSPEELACKIYTPAYISLEYVLQKSGIVFQYDTGITIVSYLSRIVNVDGYTLKYRKIKNDLLYNNRGIIILNNGINIAIPERALLDTLYLNKEMYFDSTLSMKEDTVNDLLSLYKLKRLYEAAKELF